MTNRNFIRGLAAAGIALAMVVSTAESGINGGGRSRGAITAFASIFVNGIEYETDTATILRDGVPVTQADLRVGHVVLVEGVVNADGVTGTAVNVYFESDVRGVVAAVDPGSASFTVLGQTVRVNAATTFDAALSPASLGGLQAGSAVEVSGYRNASDELVATYVGPASGEARVLGVVVDHDPVSKTFRFGNLLVDYRTASGAVDSVDDGVTIEAEGTASGAGALVARSIEVETPGLGSSPGDSSSIEGYVTATYVGGFVVNGQAVAIAPETVIVDGSVADVAADAKVAVEGIVDTAGVLVAEKITIRYDDAGRTLGTVTAVDLARGEVRVNGLVAVVNADTEFRDSSNARLRNFTLAQLRVGDTVDVRGFEARAPRTIRAKRIERVKPQSRVELEAVATSVRSGEFTLLDTVVRTSSGTKFEDKDARRLTAQQFYAQAAGREVKIRGRFDGVSWVADQAAIKN